MDQYQVRMQKAVLWEQAKGALRAMVAAAAGRAWIALADRDDPLPPDRFLHSSHGRTFTKECRKKGR